MKDLNGLKILILEDEFITQEALAGILIKRGAKIVGRAMNAYEAIGILENKKTDLALLDINVQGAKDGIWLAEQLNEKYKIPFIFITAYKDEDTINKAIEHSPYGYIVKPFMDNEVFAAIQIAKLRHEQLKAEEEKRKQENPTIFIKENYQNVKLNLDKVLYMRSSRNYVEVHSHENKQLIRTTISALQEELPNYFMQVHRSYIVNTNKIHRYTAQSIVIQETEIPVSNKFRADFMQKMEER